jgi:hypothetical protein
LGLSGAKLLALGRSSVYYTPRGTSERDLALMRRLDELHPAPCGDKMASSHGAEDPY